MFGMYWQNIAFNSDVSNACLALVFFLFRCLALLCPTLSSKLSTGLNGKIVIICIWLYANILLIPIYAQVNTIFKFRSVSKIYAEIL